MNEKFALVMLKILKHIIGIFTGTFLVAYLHSISNNNVITTATYYIIVYFLIVVFLLLFRNYAKSKHRMKLLRLSYLGTLGFILSIIIFKEQLANYIWIAAIFYGFGEGAYYSTYNQLESGVITNKERSRFIGYMNSLNDLVSILVPFVLGSSLTFARYDQVAFLILMLIILQLFFSFQIKVENKEEKCQLRRFWKKLRFKKYHDVISLLQVEFLKGLTFNGAFATTITLFTVMIFKTNFDLGVLSSVFAVIGIITSFLFGKVVKKEHYRPLLIYTSSLTIISLIGIAITPSPLTIILYNFCQAFSIRLLTMISELNMWNLSNQEGIQEYRVEYLITRETVLGIGRVISYSLLLFVGFFSDLPLLNIFIIFFILVIILFITKVVRLQDELAKHKEV